MSRWSILVLTAPMLMTGILTTGIFCTGAVHGQEKPKPVTSATFRVYHVLSTKGTKPRVPKPLQRFAKNLARVGTSHKIEGKPQVVTLKAGTLVPLKLPKNLRPALGTGSLRLATDGSVTVTLKPVKPKRRKDLLRVRSRVFPFFLIDEKRFRVEKELYLLIIEKIKPSPK